MELSRSSTSPLFPANRAFVVQFQGPAEDTSLLEHGRVEHLISGQASHFASLVQLLGFMSQTLNDLGTTEPLTPPKQR